MRNILLTLFEGTPLFAQSQPNKDPNAPQIYVSFYFIIQFLVFLLILMLYMSLPGFLILPSGTLVASLCWVNLCVAATLLFSMRTFGSSPKAAWIGLELSLSCPFLQYQQCFLYCATSFCMLFCI